MKILQADNLIKIYGSGENEVHALDGVNFSVKRRICCYCWNIRIWKINIITYTRWAR